MKEHTALRVANYIIWGLFIIVLAHLLLWYYPRDTVNIYKLESQKAVYEVGETIKLEAEGETLFEGKSYYDRRLVCNNGRYLLSTFESATTVTPRKKAIHPSGVIPEIPTPDTCKVRVQSTHEIQILPLITRTYYNQWESNEFIVK